jgi:SAM-dependent methyltransferase
MMATAIARKLSRAASVYQDMGMAAVLSRLLHRLSLCFGRDNAGHARWLRQKSAVDAAFDAANRTETGGIQEIFQFNIVGSNARHGLSHIASDPNHFSGLMTKLNVDLGKFTFVDLGSGKGRALMLATAFPFRRIVGVEFATELYDAARVNLAAFKTGQKLESRVEVICGDAAAYAFPNEPLIIYLFNPFGPAIVSRVAANALASWRDAPRPLHVIYANPVHLSCFIDAGWELSDSGSDHAHFVPPSPAHS